jgi:hypothetical protein
MMQIVVLVASVGESVMSAYYFHCTDGISFFADQQGRSIPREDDIFLAAMRTAEQVMQRLPSMSDWSGWLVSVYDDLGQMVEVFDFPNLRPSFPAWSLDSAGRETARLGLCCQPAPKLARTWTRSSLQSIGEAAWDPGWAGAAVPTSRRESQAWIEVIAENARCRR